MSSAPRAHWGSRLAFILAAAGSAVGLGNIWKFPYMAGTNGGGAFVLVYLICIAVVGIPILIAEMYIGQQSQKNAVEAFEVLDKKGSLWRLAGVFGVGAAFLILSFYSVVGGWILEFLYHSVIGTFTRADDASINGALGDLLSSPLRQTIWHIVFMGLTVGIVLGGVSNGLEKWAKILMPGLFAILFTLLIYCFTLDGFGDAFSFMFSFKNTDQLTRTGVLEAVGQAFFSLSLGMGAIITYGSYLKKDENLLKTSMALAALDTFVALAAGIVVFSIVFSFGLEPGAGPGLIFSTLPLLFSKIGGGYFISIIFFLLVVFAAVTSAVSILEVVVAYWTETKKAPRKKTTIIAGSIIFSLGMLSVLSTNIMSDVKIFGLTFFDLFDKISSSYMLPIGGLLICLFFGWKLSEKAMAHVVKDKIAQTGLLWLTRLIAPIAVFLILYNAVAATLGLPTLD